jgi:hypothetical protein
MNLSHHPKKSCDCHCRVHHGHPRTSYSAKGCVCLITCSTQPLTLVVKEWGCALFLHPDSGQLWFVVSLAGEKWDWESADEIDDRADVFEISQVIEMLLHQMDAAIATGSL